MVSKKQVTKALKKCIDPEIGISIVDLGFIQDIKIDGSNVLIKMTLTTPGCPMRALLVENAREAVKKLPGVKEVRVELVFDKPWSPEMMSAAARKKLG